MPNHVSKSAAEGGVALEDMSKSVAAAPEVGGEDPTAKGREATAQ